VVQRNYPDMVGGPLASHTHHSQGGGNLVGSKKKAAPAGEIPAYARLR